MGSNPTPSAKICKPQVVQTVYGPNTLMFDDDLMIWTYRTDIRDNVDSRGGVAEWSKATVLKTVGLFRVSWVRIPPPPPVPSKQLKIWRGGRVVEGARLLSE